MKVVVSGVTLPALGIDRRLKEVPSPPSIAANNSGEASFKAMGLFLSLFCERAVSTNVFSALFVTKL